MTGEHPVWEMVDEGWGRRAVDFATLAEPSSVREYVMMQHRLGVDRCDRLVDVACGSGLALELAGLRGAVCAGIDASPRLIAVARDRNPDADLRVGDMYALPWPDAGFDVATSFRGIWATTPEALAEIYRVLVAGGRVGITAWGHLKVSAAVQRLIVRAGRAHVPRPSPRCKSMTVMSGFGSEGFVRSPGSL
jgi:ubiquinone/menaquinone biosynthesis C-methylase UbiE